MVKKDYIFNNKWLYKTIVIYFFQVKFVVF